MKEIKKTVKKALAELLDVEEKEINGTSSLQDEFGIDSTEKVDLILMIEKGQKQKIKKEEFIQLNTVNDIVSYISSLPEEK
jgi:acyl carrier protein